MKSEEEPIYRGADCLRAYAGGTGHSVPENCRILGIAALTFYLWHNAFTGMLPNDLERRKFVGGG